jgi:hypothetical protein
VAGPTGPTGAASTVTGPTGPTGSGTQGATGTTGGAAASVLAGNATYGTGVIIVQRVVAKETIVYIYQKKIFNWGGISFFRDGASITESTFEQETKP